MILYSQILDNAGPAFGAVLRHIRDRPGDGCLFHCTGANMTGFGYKSRLYTICPAFAAGKDRTGVLAAVLLKVRRVTPTV